MIKRVILRGFESTGYSIVRTTALETKVRQTQAWAAAKENEIEAKVQQTEAWTAAREKEIETKALDTHTWAAAKEKEIEAKVQQTRAWAAAKEKEIDAKISETKAWAAAKEKEVDTRIPEANGWARRRPEDVEAKAFATGASAGADGASQTPSGGQQARPLVSIALTTYNQKRFVLEAVKGVLSQTYAPLDIVILDDASSDGTGEVIAAELARNSERTDVRFIRNERNLGGWANVRKGIALARGEFLIEACGDDVMLPEMVEKMVGVWRGQNVSLVTANAIYIDEESKELNRFLRDPLGPFDESFETLARDGSNTVCFGASMGVERTVLDEFGLPPDYLSCADIMLPFYAYLLKGACFIPEPLLKYRVHRRNTSLSLRAESSSGIENLLVQEQIFLSHLTHAFEMDAVLDRLNERDAARFGHVVRRIKPLVAVQAVEMGRKLVRTRIELARAGAPARAGPAHDGRGSRGLASG